jgi:Protein of unknown function (DUF2442)
MTTAADREALIRAVRVTKDEIVAALADGRVISVPLAWSWRLSEATPAQRANFRLIGGGQGIHWPDVDEDISVEGMLHGSPAPRPRVQPVGKPAKHKAKSRRQANSPMQRTAGGTGRR